MDPLDLRAALGTYLVRLQLTHRLFFLRMHTHGSIAGKRLVSGKLLLNQMFGLAPTPGPFYRAGKSHDNPEHIA
jgi:hypothetical protein